MVDVDLDVACLMLIFFFSFVSFFAVKGSSPTCEHSPPSTLPPLIVNLEHVRCWDVVAPGHQFGHCGLMISELHSNSHWEKDFYITLTSRLEKTNPQGSFTASPREDMFTADCSQLLKMISTRSH